MSRGRSYLDYLADMLDAFEEVEQFIQGMTFDTFAGDDKTIFAVVRALEIIGEATKRIPQTVRDREPSVLWRECAINYHTTISALTSRSFGRPQRKISPA